MGTGTHNYTEDELDILATVNIFCSVLSLFGALFIMFNYFTFPEFKQNFAFKLIFCVAIGDLVTSIGNLFGNPDDFNTLCVIQGIMAEAGALTSICWVTAISMSIWIIITQQTPPTNDDTSRWLKRMHIVIWTYIAICTILPLLTNSYGPAGGWCWIKAEKSADTIWRMLLFYVPLWICVLFMLFVYCHVWNKLNATAVQSNQSEAFLEHEEDEESVSEMGGADIDYNNDEDNEQNGGGRQRSRSRKRKDTSSQSSTLQRMKYYPMVLIFCYTPATIRRLHELFSGGAVQSPFVLAVLQVMTTALIGLANATVYGFSQRAVREKDMAFMQTHCFCCRSNNRNRHEVDNKPNV